MHKTTRTRTEAQRVTAMERTVDRLEEQVAALRPAVEELAAIAAQIKAEREGQA